MLCKYYDHLGKGVVLESDIQKLVQAEVLELKLSKKGLPVERIGTHSLREGGTMALTMNGESRDMIKKI